MIKLGLSINGFIILYPITVSIFAFSEIISMFDLPYQFKFTSKSIDFYEANSPD